MELIVLYSIILFSILIIALFLYLVAEKIYAEYKEKRKQKYQESISSLLDGIISELDEKEVTDVQISILSNYLKDKTKREVIEERMLFYFENFKGSISTRLTKLAEDIGLVDYEIKKLNSRDLHEVALAARHLGAMRSKKAIAKLLELIYLEHVGVKYNVLMALARIGDEEAFIEAFKRLTESIPLSERSLVEIADSFEGDKIYVYRKLIYIDDDFISSIFIKSAGNYKDTMLADEIALFLTSENKEKKIAAMKALGNMGDNRYVEAIISLLEDEDWEVRAIAAKVLGQMQSEKALVPLAVALSDREWYVRYNAANSLISIEGGMDIVYDILDGQDKFAKDIIIAVLETSYGWDKVLEYDKFADRNPRLSEKIRKYIEEKDR
ncbi:HEAT repeat [Thermosyntropha lipolytica DSM 11003]|uniref:HEAT repeat n=1 Tax=Thermosyntropha lipolytica DSM 11003 TaxID=1123382 RepID=A0A1M5QJF6_9FIRM|nr:HEAT repeat domain-containing protein [Thermosyntropha lipolytica]SHH14264.1 HEAT repeat [Thermosyntropha lipolytica DSM 11003]